LLRSVHELWSNPKEAGRFAAADRRVLLPGDPGVVVIDLHSESVKVGGIGFVLAAFFGLAAWVPVVSSVFTGAHGPVAALVVCGVLGSALLTPVVVFGIGKVRTRRVTDRLRIDPVWIVRTGEFISFDVAWSQVHGVGIVIGEAFRGETRPVPGRLVRRSRGSRVAIEFRPVDPVGFARANPVLSTGPAYQRFAASSGGRYGCDLGVCRQRTVDHLIAAIQQSAPDQWLGVKTTAH
jgi:hypothetical protein